MFEVDYLDGASYGEMTDEQRSSLPHPNTAGRDINRFVWDAKRKTWFYDWLGQ